MNRFVSTFTTSIGKKMVMAVTGLMLSLFILVHLVGNLFYYSGKVGFESYSAHLHGHLLLLGVARVCLVLFAVLHVAFGIVLYVQNMMSRPTGYIVKKGLFCSSADGGQTVASRLMPYTGLYILLFLLDHLFAFTFVDRTSSGGLYHMVSTAFHNPFYVAFYALSVIVVGFHVSHGFWSAFQTLGANHPGYMPAIMIAGRLYAVVIGLAFASIPLYIYFF